MTRLPCKTSLWDMTRTADLQQQLHHPATSDSTRLGVLRLPTVMDRNLRCPSSISRVRQLPTCIGATESWYEVLHFGHTRYLEPTGRRLEWPEQR
jgi:hypothetical protein